MIRKSDLCDLRTLMLNSRLIEVKTSYLRYDKNLLIQEFDRVICEYQQFISKHRSLYTKEEKDFIQKYHQYCRDYILQKTPSGSFTKMAFQFFCHIVNQYRYFKKNVE